MNSGVKFGARGFFPRMVRGDVARRDEQRLTWSRKAIVFARRWVSRVHEALRTQILIEREIQARRDESQGRYWAISRRIL